MPMSMYVSGLRAHIGHDLLLLPAVTAVIRDGDRFLVARRSGSEAWGLIGGGIEPGEEPREAVAREVLEEIGVRPTVHGTIDAYGGAELTVEYENGDRVSYITVAFDCTIPHDAEVTFVDRELVEVGWFTIGEIGDLVREPAVDRILLDATRLAGVSGERDQPVVVDKVVCYVIHQDRLLVFTHDEVDLAITGVQVPAGSIRPGEPPHEAAERELLEETGLLGRVLRSLGSELYDLSPLRNETARRHFFLMAVDDPDVLSVWKAGETDAATGGPSVTWTCRWIPVSGAHVLAGGLGARIGAATR